MATLTHQKTRRRNNNRVYTKPYLANAKTFRGRLPNGKVGLNQKENKACIEMLRRGIGHQAIAEACGLTLNQVQYRAAMSKTSVMEYRRGESSYAVVILERFSVIYQY